MTPAGGRLRALLGGPRGVGLGLAVFLACGVVTALLAARLLEPADYTVFAAFSGVLGVLVLAPAGSLEQESALRGGAGDAQQLRRAMLQRALAVWAVVAVVALLPLGGWQHRLLGPESGRALTALLLGAPVVLVLAVLRGLAVARAAFALVTGVHVLAGGGTLLLPLLLLAVGVPPLTAFVAGAAFAWLPALLLLLLRSPAGQRVAAPASSTRTAFGTALLVLANLLLLANLLAVPPLLRWHVDALGAEPVAHAQLLVSVSRLATTAVLGFLPLVLGSLAVREGGAVRLPVPALVLATATGLATVGASGLLGGAFVELLTGRSGSSSVALDGLAALPVALLCPAVVLMAVCIARGRYGLVCLAWSCGLAVLGAAFAVDPGDQLGVVLGAVLVASALPLLVLAAGLLPAGGRVSGAGPPRRGAGSRPG